MRFTCVKVGDLCEQIRGVSYEKGEALTSPRPGYVPILRANNITDRGLVYDELVYVPEQRVSAYQRLRRFDVVIAASSGSKDVVGKAAPVLDDFDGSFGAFCKVLRPNQKVDPRYFAHFFKTKHYRQTVSALAAGANISNLRNEHLEDLDIPLPSLSEQMRIAEVLDRAEALINSRRKSLTTLDGLIRTLFVDSFGDIAINTRRWPTIRLQELLTAPPRNGVSPAKGGTANYNVLTLSAITGSEFDVTAVKNGSFVSIPGPQYMVDENDFLICRGNGNLDLVGRGYFPPYSMPGVIFPDTMIAIRLSADLVDKVFFEQMWNSPLVRRQIELLARTTNGTYKINQTMLADITLVVPPIELQRKFGEQVSTIQQLKSKYRTSLVQFEALYASLQHRAFKGEL